MNEPTPEKINRIISEIKKVSKNCKSAEDFVNLAFNFEYEDFNLVPLQKKGEILTLIKLLEKLNPKLILEIGTAAGGTLFLLSKISNPNAKIISIDLPEGPFKGELYPDWKKKIYESFSSQKQKIHLIRANSQEAKTRESVKKFIGKKKNQK